MRIVQITPGAGAMYCGNCLRDNALVRSLRKTGHDVLMIPLYLPLTLDEPDESAGTPIFFSGISVYLEQKLPLFRYAPDWFHQALASRKLLKWASGRAAKTRASELGDLTLSMLQGEEGHQAREVDKLIDFLKHHHRPEVICISNLLLTGLVHRLKADIGAPVVCLMQGEDSFLDALPESHRERCWNRVGQNAAQADCLVAASGYYGDKMVDRLKVDRSKVRVVYSGVDVSGYGPATRSRGSRPRALGFFARMCHDKGLDTVVDAFIHLHKDPAFDDLELHVGGSCGPADQPYVDRLKAKLEQAHLLYKTRFLPNVTREQKIEFLQALDVFSVPARYGEAFGLYLVEAMAAGVPIVQPRAAAFPEIVELSRAGLLCEPEAPSDLAKHLAGILSDRASATTFAAAGIAAAHQHFSIEAMAHGMLEVYKGVVRGGVPAEDKSAAPTPAMRTGKPASY